MRRVRPEGTPEFQPWLDLWQLVPDGSPTMTRTGRFLPVTSGDLPAMLKVVTEPEENDGTRVLAWWEGEGAARVYAFDDGAVLLERAMGNGSLSAMAREGRDVEATTLMCQVASMLHAKDPTDRPASVLPLDTWFRELGPVARSRGGVLGMGAAVAQDLLASQRDLVVLHGDLHHDNVLDFGSSRGSSRGSSSGSSRGGSRGARGWLAIDPKGLYGERTFDFVNLLRNPSAEVGLAPGRFEAHVAVIAREARLEAKRLLEWTLAFACLSAAWILNDGVEPELDLSLAALAAAHLGR